MVLQALEVVFVVEESALGGGDHPGPVQAEDVLGDPGVGGDAAVLAALAGHLALVVRHHHHVELLDEAAMRRDQHPHWPLLTLHNPLSKVSEECPDSVSELLTRLAAGGSPLHQLTLVEGLEDVRHLARLLTLELPEASLSEHGPCLDTVC